MTAAVGPVLGGWLVATLSWRWVFFINLPLALVVLAILYARVPESRDDQVSGGLDWVGAGLSVLALGGVVYGLIESANFGFKHPLVLTALVVGSVAIPAFLLVEARAKAPMVPLSMFRDRGFLGANLLTLLLYGALGGSLFFLPFNLIVVQGYSATAAGAAWLPFIIIIAALSRWAGGLVQRYGAKLPLVLGPAVTAAGFGLLAVPGVGGSYWTTFFPGVVVLGIGMGITVAPLVTVVLATVEPRVAGVASGINNAVSRSASLLALAVFGVVMLATFNSSLDSRLDAIEPPPPVVAHLEDQRVRLAAAELPPGIDVELQRSLERAIDQAFVSSFRTVMLLGGGLALASSLVALLLIERRRSEETAEA